jgi:hypothetical protein
MRLCVKDYTVSQLKDSINQQGVSDHESITCWEERPDLKAKDGILSMTDVLPYYNVLHPSK